MDGLTGGCALRRSLRLLCVQRRIVRSRPVPERVWRGVCGHLRWMCVGELQQRGRRELLRLIASMRS